MRVHMMMIERQTANGHTNAATARDDHPPFKPGDMSEKDRPQRRTLYGV